MIGVELMCNTGMLSCTVLEGKQYCMTFGHSDLNPFQNYTQYTC